MTRHRLLSLALLCSFAPVVACSGSGDATPGSELLASACDDALDSVYEGLTPPADWGPEMRGDITRCAFERVVSVDEMAEAFTVQDTFIDPGLSTPVSKFRIQYWTERNEGEPQLTSASLYIPETRRADPSPLVVLGHGSVGIADSCAPSLEDPEGFNKDWRVLVYSYAADGWITIMPDNPGLGTPGTTAWLYSVDEGHTLLDATRAARKLFAADTLTERNAMIGLSAGAHAVISAQALADEYGFEGTIETVVAQSPIWLTAGIWGTLASEAGSLFINSTLMSVTMQYFVGHLAVYEGEDAIADAFIPSLQDPAINLLDSGCWSQVTSEDQGPPSIGVNEGPDLFTPAYVAEVGECGLSDDCPSDLAQTWRARWVVDRPPPNTTIPIVHWTGGLDDFIPPGFQQCGLDRLDAQGADLTACVEPLSDHSGIVPRSAGWVRQHLEAVLLDGDPPAPCEPLATWDPELVCSIPLIPNSLDPSDP
ncbi:MAG: lipase family protein [Myxococcota bacterium]